MPSPLLSVSVVVTDQLVYPYALVEANGTLEAYR